MTHVNIRVGYKRLEFLNITKSKIGKGLEHNDLEDETND